MKKNEAESLKPHSNLTMPPLRRRHRRRLLAAVVFLLLSAVVAHPAAGAFTELESAQIGRFQDYLRIRTAHPSPDYAGAAAFLLPYAASLGLRAATLHFTPCKSKPLLLLTWPGTDPSLSSLLLNSHLDSVPAEPQQWLHPPFAAHRDAATGRVYARGAQDDKCLPIQYLEAIRGLRDAGFAPTRTLHISLVPDEEIGGADGFEKFAQSEEFRDLNVGFMLDEGQASLTDEFRVFYGDRLVWRLIVKATGAPGHGSKLFDGAAVENLMDCVETIAGFREAQFGMVKSGKRGPGEVVSVNPVYMKAGTPSPTGFVMNMQPSEAEVGFDFRLPPTEDVEHIIRRIKEEWAPAHKNLTYKKGPTRDLAGRPMVTPTNASNPWWSVFEQAIISAGGKLAKPEILSSTTDSRFIRQLGIPALGFSPMTNTPILLHDNNEFLEDKVFLRGIKVYEHIIRALSSFKG
uniref:N-acyl-aliphatic-L-amino acid amidohydrolase n=1 Tax=Oryza nivara TaxID=4536 RepID=A0A0E0HML7_ORYNI